ncbi:hypothetical protein [Adhaeribacter terreus]|uniref:DUF2306 domain-containing protein n=1 Tax=Adhaeribacter terreus TaxID=529703 RepID=A0ABW0ECY8_9BACT
MYKAILFFHILAGTVALGSGLVAIFATKGRNNHRRSGRIYEFSMYAVAVSAILMCLLKFNPFLLAIAVFSLYLTYTGKRALFYFRLREKYQPGFPDKLPAFAGLLTGMFMIGFPVWQMLQSGTFFVPVLAVFGSGLLGSSIGDLFTFRKPELFGPNNKAWLLKHIGMMGGAYIATVTAFLVNNVHMQQQWLVWIGPTVVGTVLISRAIRTWRGKLKLQASKKTVGFSGEKL